MEIRHLKYFLKLAEELNFRRASEKLFIAQPALSRQIQQLEKELEVKLFFRNKRRVELLEAGQLLKEEIIKLFEKLENLKVRLKLVDAGLTGELRIGYVGSAMHSVLPNLLLKYREAYPNIVAKLHEWTTVQQIQAVQKGELDIAFVRSKPYMADLTFKSVYKENLALALPNMHKINKKNFKSLADVANENFIFVPRESGNEFYDKIINLCNRSGFSPKIVHETVFGNTTIKLIESGFGISILPSSLEENNSNIKFIQLPEVVDLYICYSNRIKSGIVNNFISIAEGKAEKIKGLNRKSPK